MFRCPDYIFMPKIWFRDVSGMLMITSQNTTVEINVYMQGFSDMEDSIVTTNIEK